MADRSPQTIKISNELHGSLKACFAALQAELGKSVRLMEVAMPKLQAMAALEPEAILAMDWGQYNNMRAGLEVPKINIGQLLEATELLTEFLQGQFNKTEHTTVTPQSIFGFLHRASEEPSINSIGGENSLQAIFSRHSKEIERIRQPRNEPRLG